LSAADSSEGGTPSDDSTLSESADRQPSGLESALTTGCLLILVLVADVAATFLVVIVLSVRALGRMDAGTGQRASNVLPPDWGPVVGFGALALVVGLTAVALVWVGHRVIGAVQLTLCVVLMVHALGFWP
jgi:hypothetical protein